MKLASVTFRQGTRSPARTIRGGELVSSRLVPRGCVELAGKVHYPAAIECIELAPCSICGEPMPIAAKGETCGTKSCAATLRHQRERT